VTLEWDTGPSTAAVEPGDYALGVAAIPPWERDEWDGPVFGRACTDGSRNDATVVAVQHGPMRTGRFIVKIDDVEVPGWHSVAIPSRSTEQDEYREENGETDWGQTSFDDLEMERGVKPNDTTLYDWAEAVRQGDVEEGRKEIAVVLLDESGETQAEWELQKAWPKEYDPPELEASADGDVATESITVAYDKMDRKEQ
jgi:phage tail-like protein